MPLETPVSCDGERRLDVSVYLLRPGREADAERDLFVSDAMVFELSQQFPGARFISMPTEALPPRWLSYVSSLLADPLAVDLQTQSPGGLLWIPRKGRVFVLTFGHAHAKLKEAWLESEFGKRAALNLIPPGQVVELRAEQVFARWHVASERAPKASGVEDFGFDASRDLVAAVEGVPSGKYANLLGTKLRGGTSLKLGLRFSQLRETLDLALERFGATEYRRAWPRVDNLIQVRDVDLCASLDTALNGVFADKRAGDRISLAAPAARSGDKQYPQHFIIGRRRKNAATAPYLLYGNWLSHLREKGSAPSVESAVETTIHLLDENKEPIDTCSMYECFGAEVTYAKQTYILSSGVWYQAKPEFVSATNAVIATLKPPPYALPNWNSKDDEGRYNEQVSRADKSIWLFDKRLVFMGGGASKFEFCDLMHRKSRTLYFVKQPSGSASVSHLCEQVRRTAELFFDSDSTFRDKLAASIEKRAPKTDTSWLSARPQRGDWNLCLVSMGKTAPQLPFFARCGITRLNKELESGGFNVRFQAV